MAAQVKILDKVVDGGPALHVPGHLSFGQYMIDKLRERSEGEDKVALINGATGHKTTYRQILQDVVNVASGLRKMGIKRGDVVALCSENRDEYMPTAIGAICCGATITTANLQYTKDEMKHILNISRPNIIFCSEEALKENLKTFKSASFIKKIIQFGGAPTEKGVISFNSIAIPTNIHEYEPEDVQGCADTAFILYSSGTTGHPKGVMLSHLNLLYAAANFDNEAAREDRKDSNQINLTLVPWYHAYGLMSTMNYLAVGTVLVYFASFDPIKYLNAIQEYKVTVLLAVPPLVVFLAKVPFLEEFDMSSVTSVWCGAAPLSAETINEAMKRLPNCKGIFQAYGMTETSLAAISDTDEEGVKPRPGSGGMPLRGVKAKAYGMTETSLAATKDTDAEGVKPKPGSGGMPLRGVKGKVVDLETRQKRGPRQEGEICLKGPIIMKGYCGNLAATRNMLDEEGYLKTGDIGYYDEDGYFFVVDRLKELIKYKGSQVPPAMVESVLLQHAGVAECGVVGAPDERVGELATAFVTLKPDASVTEKELLEFTNSRNSGNADEKLDGAEEIFGDGILLSTNKLSPEKRLYGGVIFVDEIPKNPSGKILRRVLKQQLVQKRKRSKL